MKYIIATAIFAGLLVQQLLVGNVDNVGPIVVLWGVALLLMRFPIDFSQVPTATDWHVPVQGGGRLEFHLDEEQHHRYHQNRCTSAQERRDIWNHLKACKRCRLEHAKYDVPSWYPKAN